MTDITKEFARALSGLPIGYRAKTKGGVKRRAKALGHELGRWTTRYYSARGWGKKRDIMYHVAHCSRCDMAAFTGKMDSNPALDRTCPGKQEAP